MNIFVFIYCTDVIFALVFVRVGRLFIAVCLFGFRGIGIGMLLLCGLRGGCSVIVIAVLVCVIGLSTICELYYPTTDNSPQQPTSPPT